MKSYRSLRSRLSLETHNINSTSQKKLSVVTKPVAKKKTPSNPVCFKNAFKALIC